MHQKYSWGRLFRSDQPQGKKTVLKLVSLAVSDVYTAGSSFKLWFNHTHEFVRSQLFPATVQWCAPLTLYAVVL